ncbi:hypothetical protein [Pseudothermotoga thermarum]|uniref:FlgN family protein n=1 Tax=Pseudothermotoga thermarum DSM 5069 TaxID=688269 RepID=F7YTV9_9THEM|nr:hypothetical protein [Pseudothermotoga thermarum]AEH51406.1 hypothetical protein Theth_1342 [Pseudothermotoga thermarum DSM 5069]
MQAFDEQLVKRLLEIEEQLDQLLEEERFEEMSTLLDERKLILEKFTDIPVELAKKIFQADQNRMEKIKHLMEQISQQAKQSKQGQTGLNAYKSLLEQTTNKLDKLT